MDLITALKLFIGIFRTGSNDLAAEKAKNVELTEKVNQLTQELAEARGEAVEAVELIAAEVDLNGPRDELAQAVIDSEEIETPPELDNPAIGDPTVETPAEVEEAAIKAVIDSVSETDGVEPSALDEEETEDDA